ncbi:hypothetical protein E2C01_028460 [Portunus trituberculatus]|uniref:Uncharacterized protein n=1 Tax=Portunus trituberculatus TaxID=210409 RepID=A0A5B7EKH6_PORTR|nr:hypothetical protein [Portunus trituberculatus]
MCAGKRPLRSDPLEDGRGSVVACLCPAPPCPVWSDAQGGMASDVTRPGREKRGRAYIYSRRLEGKPQCSQRRHKQSGEAGECEDPNY